MNKYGWKIGERVTLKSTVWPVDLDFRIVGVIDNDRAPHFWFNREYLDQALREKGATASASPGRSGCASDPRQVSSIMRKVDEMSRNSEAETSSETEKSFFANFFGSLQDWSPSSPS